MKRFILAAILPLSLAGCSPRLGMYQSVGYQQGKFMAAATHDAETAARETKALFDKFASERESIIWNQFHSRYAGVLNQFAARGQSIPADQVAAMLSTSWAEQDQIQADILAQRAHILSLTAKLDANALDMPTLQQALENERAVERDVRSQQTAAIVGAAKDLTDFSAEQNQRALFEKKMAATIPSPAAPVEHVEAPAPIE